MSGKRYNIEQLKIDYIGKTFNWLTVIDVVRNDKNVVCFVCECKCGNIKTVDVKRIFSNKVKSCGCKRCSSNYKYDVDELKHEYIGTNKHFLTITDVYRCNKDNRIHFICKCRCGNITDVTMKLFNQGKSYSCGCYKSSTEYKLNESVAQKKYHKEHPEVSVKQSEFKKQWCIDNPEKVKEISEHNKQLYIDEPYRRNIVGRRISEWFKNDITGVEKWKENRKCYYNEHPEIGENRSKLYKEKPEILTKIAEGNHKYNIEHPEKVKRINNINKQIAKEKRVIIDDYKSCHFNDRCKFTCRLINCYRNKRTLYNTKELIKIVHPEYHKSLLSGDLASYDFIETKCPICGNYDKHKLHNVFVFSKGKFKSGSPPLCKKCFKSHQTSHYEKEISDFINSFYSDELIKNDRTTLNGKELDIYIPEKKIAIEFNGDYWHSIEYKDKDYHLNKFILCKEKGILLVSIFESQWNKNKNNIKDYLRDLFNSKENQLSFNDDKTLMNNNYPCIKYLNSCSSFIDNYYVYNKSIVYTCGYSYIGV